MIQRGGGGSSVNRLRIKSSIRKEKALKAYVGSGGEKEGQTTEGSRTFQKNEIPC